MNKTFFARFALPILMLVFFCVPFALRGARMSFTTMKNDVKDWLPADFDETKDLDWFRANFLGEQFVLVTWPGCTADDTRFQLMVEKLRSEVAHPDALAPVVTETAEQDADEATDEANTQNEIVDAAAVRERDRDRARQMGDRLGLSLGSTYFENWGGQGEKWLVGHKDAWYYITPAGNLYRWNGGDNLLGWAGRRLEKLTTGKNTAQGELVATLGEQPTNGKVNEYHNDPRKLTARFFKTVTTGPDVLARLAGPNGGLWPRGDYSDEEKREIAERTAIARLTGSLFGPDGKQTCMIVTLSDVARRDLKRVLGRELMGKPPGRLLQIAQEAGLSHDDLRMGGPPVDNVAIDEEGSITLVNLIGWSLALGVFLAYISFRSVKVTIMIFFVGGVSAIVSLSLVWYSGDFVDAIVMSMPSLVYVLGLTSAVHMITYYRHHCQEHGLHGASEATISHTWKPLMLGQITSAIGLISLLTSNLLPIRKFGLYASLGTLATLVVMYLYLPSALQMWPPGYHKRRERAAESTSFEQWMHNATSGFWRNFSGIMVRNHYWIAPAVFVFVCIMAYGTTLLKTNVQLLKMFDGNAKIIRDYAWMEQNLGRLVPMEMVVRVSPEVSAPLSTAASAEQQEERSAATQDLKSRLVQYTFLERMEIADHVQRAIENKFGPQGQDILGQGMSAVTFAPPLPAPGSGWRSTRGVINRKLEQHRDEFLTSDYLRIDKDEAHAGSELWRISLRLGALNNVDYGEFVSDLKCVVEPVLAACRHRQAVLSTLADLRPEQGLVGARVAVIGISAPEKAGDEAPAGKASALKVRNVSATAVDQDAMRANKQQRYADDQARLFATTLSDLLENRGFKNQESAKTRLEFIDAESLANEGKPLTSEQLATKLAGFDCVVLAKEIAGYDHAALQRMTSHLIDARDFQFNPSGGEFTAAKRNDPIHAIYTGVVPVVYKAQRTLLDSLVDSTRYAFVSIALCLMILLRRGPLRITNLLNVRAGLVAMFPNIFPLVVVFGAIGYLGIEVDIGTMMTASIAIGVAVDDTIHYLEWFRNGMKRGLSRHEAIIAGYEHCGSAIIETMLIGGLGLSVFAFSSFTPTQRFGTMMLTMLFVGACGELIWMPALLASPLGKYFEPIISPPATGTVAPAVAVAGGDTTSIPKMQHDAPHSSKHTVRRDVAH